MNEKWTTYFLIRLSPFTWEWKVIEPNLKLDISFHKKRGNEGYNKTENMNESPLEKRIDNKKM